MERGNGLLRRRLDGIGHRDEPGDDTVDGGEHDRLPLPAEFVGFGAKGRTDVGAQILHLYRITDSDPAVVHDARHPLARRRLKVSHRRQVHAALLRLPQRSPTPADAR
jgi:hypothetical protein